MKPLRPSQRERKRYLLLSGKNLEKNIFQAILDFIGILGLSKASPEVIKRNKGSLIISVNRKSLDSIKASFAVFTEKISVKKISGTLKGLEK